MDLYMAGSTFQELDEWMQQKGYDKLFSQLNDRKGIKNWVDFKQVNHTDSKLFIDSGAFTVHTKGATVDVDEYIDYINSIEPYITVFVQVDHIPGVWGRPRTDEEVKQAPAKSWENYIYMRQRVNNPDKLMPVFHQQEDFSYLDQMLEYKDPDTGKQIPYICISTNKDVHIGEQERWLEKVFDMIKRSSNPNVKTHALGLTSLRVLKRFPITSADSTTWLRTATTGSIFIDEKIYKISDETQHTKDHISKRPQQVQDYIKKCVEEKGYDLELMKKDYRSREMWNVQYLQEWAAKTNCTRSDKSLLVDTLF